MQDWYCLQIGRFIYQFSQLEFTLQFTLSTMLKLDERVSTPLMASLDFASLCRSIKSVYTALHPEDTDRIKAAHDLISEIMALNDHRVAIVHSLWHPDITGQHMAAHRVTRDTHKARRLYKDRDELPKLVAKASDLHNRAWFTFGGTPKGDGASE